MPDVSYKSTNEHFGQKTRPCKSKYGDEATEGLTWGGKKTLLVGTPACTLEY